MAILTGQCHCGKNHLQVTDNPEFQFVCYCRQCRVLNSGGHLCGMMFDESIFTAPEETIEYSYSGGSGKPIKLHFCPNCGTHLYAIPTQYPGKVIIRANVLDGGDFEPQQPLFSESAFSWDPPMQIKPK